MCASYLKVRPQVYSEGTVMWTVMGKRQMTMAEKHMKTRSTSCIIRKLQIIMTMYSHCAPIPTAKSKTVTSANAGKDVEHREISFMVVGGQKGTAALKDNVSVSHKTKRTLTI